MNKISLSLLVISVGLLSGCASIVNGTNESISVTTPPVENAQCLLTNSKGTWHVKSTPGSVTVHRAYGDLHVSCHKTGCKPVTKTFKSTTKGMAFGNVVFGGIVGAGVDTADGAAYDYSQTLVVPMKCNATGKKGK
ncbi:MAG: hypothetical protein AABY34_01925 [Pseudomonadota bacterium]